MSRYPSTTSDHRSRSSLPSPHIPIRPMVRDAAPATASTSNQSNYSLATQAIARYSNGGEQQQQPHHSPYMPVYQPPPPPQPNPIQFSQPPQPTTEGSDWHH